jgi:hypothetical protein
MRETSTVLRVGWPSQAKTTRCCGLERRAIATSCGSADSGRPRSTHVQRARFHTHGRLAHSPRRVVHGGYAVVHGAAAFAVSYRTIVRYHNPQISGRWSARKPPAAPSRRDGRSAVRHGDPGGSRQAGLDAAPACEGGGRLGRFRLAAGTGPARCHVGRHDPRDRPRAGRARRAPAQVVGRRSRACRQRRPCRTRGGCHRMAERVRRLDRPARGRVLRGSASVA